MGRIVGYTTGVYDMFHVGHLRLLERAKTECDWLIVGVTTDELSIQNKGKAPIVPFEERMEIISSLKCVDAVVPETDLDKYRAWKRIGFDRIFKGDDWKDTPIWNDLEEQFSAVGVQVIFFPYTQHVSSSILREVLEHIHGQE